MMIHLPLQRFIISALVFMVCFCSANHCRALNPKELIQNTKSSVSVKAYGAKGDGLTNDRAAIQNALKTAGASIYFPAGIYKVDSYIRVANGVTVTGRPGSIVVSVANMKNDPQTGSAHQGQIFILGSNCTVQGLKIDGKNHNAGGFCLSQVKNSSVTNCTISNTGSAQGIQDYLSQGNTYKGNTITNCKSGIQLWLTSNCTISGNHVNLCSQGGIWGANPSKIHCLNNNVQNCNDVGIDWEGGQDIISEKNVVKSCKNGELAVFKNGTGGNQQEINIQFNNNNVTRTVAYLNRTGKKTPCNPSGGAMFVSSINADCKNIVFKANTVNVASGYGIYTNEIIQLNTNIIFIGNTVNSADKFLRILGTDGLLIKGNTFKGLPGSESQTNEFKNATGIRIEDNTFSFTKPKKVNTVLTWFTDRKLTGEHPLLIDNRFFNTADLAFKHDPYNSGFACILQGNSFTDGYTTNGGVSSTGNGSPVFVNQNLKLKANGTVKDLLMNSK